MSARPIFRDPDLDAEFERYGFVVVPGAARTAVPALRRAHKVLMGQAPPGFHSTPYSHDSSLKQAVNSNLGRIMEPIAATLLVDYRILLSSFVSKSRGSEGVMPPHQDWTFVDEPEATSMNMWIPLVDVDDRNGAMSVLPRGHLMPLTIRGSETLNSFCEIEDMVAKQMVSIPMTAGDVLIHDHQLLHSSPPNTKRRPRLAAGSALVQKDSKAVHYRRTGTGELSRFDLEDRFFTDYTFGDEELPASAVRVGTVAFENPIFTPDDIQRITSEDPSQ